MLLKLKIKRLKLKTFMTIQLRDTESCNDKKSHVEQLNQSHIFQLLIC
jgi:hypothetical protein